MTIEQTVEIPADHRLMIEVPSEIPAGRAILAFTPAGETRPRHRLTEQQGAAIEKYRGIAKGVLSSDESLEMRREDFELEEAKYRRLFPEDDGNTRLVAAEKKDPPQPTSLADSLLGIAAQVGDISLDELRTERLSRYLK
jgi:hypothetical protein